MVRKEEGESWLSPDAMFEFGSLFRTCCGISSNQTYSAMELKAISDRKHNHKHGERIGIVKRRAPPPSKEQHRSTKPVYERADITAGFIKAPAAEEEDDLSQAWITTGGDIFILPCCAPSSLPGMAISEIKTRTGTQTSKKHADSKKDHGLQKARDVMEHKQRVLANLNRSNHARSPPLLCACAALPLTLHTSSPDRCRAPGTWTRRTSTTRKKKRKKSSSSSGGGGGGAGWTR
eukprot:2043194-Rhodomonas_salina.3